MESIYTEYECERERKWERDRESELNYCALLSLLEIALSSTGNTIAKKILRK